VKQIIEEQMRLDDETTAIQLHRLLAADAFTWRSSIWEGSLLSVFTNIPRHFRVTPFHGMMDVLLKGEKGTAQLHHRSTDPGATCTSITVDSESVAFALEIGLGKAVPFEIVFAQKGKRLLRCRKSLGWTYRGSAYCQFT
jgi:hypothetical protein